MPSFRPMDRRFAFLACGSHRRGIGDAVLRRSVRAAQVAALAGAPALPPACDPKTLTGMCAQFWRYCLDAHLDGVGSLDDDFGPRALLWRDGPQKERRRHGDDELRHYLSRHCAIRGRDLQPGFSRRHARSSAGSIASSCRA